MNIERINRNIPLAIKLLKKYLVQGQKLDKELTADVSAFGTSIRQSGLLPTICFFLDKKGSSDSTGSDSAKAKERRNKLLDILSKLIMNREAENGDSLLTYAINHPNLEGLEGLLLDAVVSVKLAIRVFEKKN